MCKALGFGFFCLLLGRFGFGVVFFVVFVVFVELGGFVWVFLGFFVQFSVQRNISDV